MQAPAPRVFSPGDGATTVLPAQPAFDAEKPIIVELNDRTSNTSAPITRTVTLDTKPPTMPLVTTAMIADGANAAQSDTCFGVPIDEGAVGVNRAVANKSKLHVRARQLGRSPFRDE